MPVYLPGPPPSLHPSIASFTRMIEIDNYTSDRKVIKWLKQGLREKEVVEAITGNEQGCS